jgi:putative colanic acid biosynthesis UDP-glucose lipid carrier transferase
MLKRLLDLLISLPVVVLILPLLTMVVWLIQRLSSPGPIFFLQQRAGLGNEVFLITKYRTMSVNHGDENRQATANDNRVYPFGRFLRKLSLDEMPQFWNVLRGEMSVVGPRPHLLSQNREFEEILTHYNVRAFVKPGITGLAQVRGFRGPTDTHEALRRRIECDLYYLENWTLAMDISIILRTAWHVIVPHRTAV